MSHPCLHGIELLLLFVCQDGPDAIVGAFANRVHLGTAIFPAQRLILEKSLHLLLTLNQQRLDLRLLICSQVQFARQVLKLPIGIHVHTAAVRAIRRCAGLVLILSGGWIILGRGCAADSERQQQSAKCQSKELRLHKLSNPPISGDDAPSQNWPGILTCTGPAVLRLPGISYSKVDGELQRRMRAESDFSGICRR